MYVTNTSTYKSTDGGTTFVALRGAPGGDDYHSVWINPDDPHIILLGSDQGAVITLNGGASWSSWYNQSTAQFYHVITDDRFPYRVYGGQQESGSAEVLSRGNDGAITFHDWHPVGTEEYGYVAPDPLHPGIIYGGKVTRFDERTGQTREVGPVVAGAATATIASSALRRWRSRRPTAHALSRLERPVRDDRLRRALAHRQPRLVAARSGGAGQPRHLRANARTPSAASRSHLRARPSPRDRNVIWAGTDDGFVWRTADGGKHWRNVTPPGVGPWGEDLDRRRLAVRRGKRVCRRQPHPPRRAAAAALSHP